jgi:hypothetical protein
VVACLEVFRYCGGVPVHLLFSPSLEREGSVEEKLRSGEEAADGDRGAARHLRKERKILSSSTQSAERASRR